MNRILIVKLGALGDVVHAIPVAAALRRAFPSARIDWLVAPKHREILDLVPVIDRRLVLTDSKVLSAVRELRANNYDVAIDLQGLFKSALLARASGATRVVGFSARYARERIASWLYTEVHDPGGGGMYHVDEGHVVYTNLGVLQTLGVPSGVPEFPLDSVQSEVAAHVMKHTAGRYAILNPGAAWPNKRWPPARLGAIAWSCARDTRSARWRRGDQARRRWHERWSTIIGRRTPVAEDGDCRCRRACARRVALPVGRHRSGAHRGSCRDADRRRLRTDAAVAQRPMGPGRRHGVARRELSMPSSAAVPPRDDVSGGHSGRRSARGGGEAVGGAAWLQAIRFFARFRVALGFACGIAVFWFAAPTRTAIAVGLPVAVAGEMVRVWAAGHSISRAR